MVSTHLKNISQIGNLPQVGMKIKNISNHHLEILENIASRKPKMPCLDISLGEKFPDPHLLIKKNNFTNFHCE